MGSIERSAHDGLQTVITDNAQDGRFEATVGDQVIGRQPYRRYRGHIVLMATEVDTQWRDRGVSSAMISCWTRAARATLSVERPCRRR